jgi:glycerol-3-phosphate acyltransferase PlsY
MFVVAVLFAYLMGSIPMGYFVVKILAKRDITQVGSGRTGGTNALRAGGIRAGLMTAVLDLLKGYLAVWLVRQFFPEYIWLQVLAGVAAVIGHNWSIILYLLTRRFSAGAGTGPNVGAAMAFWPGIGLIAVPLVIFCVFIIGYGSVASLATAFSIVIAFLIRAMDMNTPWQYAVFGMATAILVIWALRPNIERLIKGTERRVGLFAKKDRSTGSI